MKAWVIYNALSRALSVCHFHVQLKHLFIKFVLLKSKQCDGVKMLTHFFLGTVSRSIPTVKLLIFMGF